jgi:hypothetical protein
MSKDEQINLVKVDVKSVPFRGPAYFEILPKDLIARITVSLDEDVSPEISYTETVYPVERIGFKLGSASKVDAYYILKEDKDRLLDLLNGFLELQKEQLETEIITDFLAYLAYNNTASLKLIAKMKDSIRDFNLERKRKAIYERKA